jgi:iron complex transport system substrate-binding protein
MRIVSLLPSITEICFALGLEEEVAAVTHECDFPEAARRKPVATRSVLPAGISDSVEIDRLVTERVAAGLPIYELDVPLLERIGPDLILTQELCEVCAVSYRDVLAVARDLPTRPEVISIEPHSLDDIIDSVETVGALTGRSEAAARTADALRRRLAAIRQRVAGADRPVPRVVCLEWLDPPMVGGHWVPEMVTLAGGRDVLGRTGEDTFRVEWTRVIDAAPDVLVLMPCGYDLPQTVAESGRLGGRVDLDAIPAVRAGRVFAVDATAYFSRPGPRAVDGVAILARIFHPDSFPDDTAPDATRRVAIGSAGTRRA